jgi:hypothetical protein
LIFSKCWLTDSTREESKSRAQTSRPAEGSFWRILLDRPAPISLWVIR